MFEGVIDPTVDLEKVPVSHTMTAVVVDVFTALHGRFKVIFPAISMPQGGIVAVYNVVESFTKESENVGIDE
jgi:hypothetical protein